MWNDSMETNPRQTEDSQHKDDDCTARFCFQNTDGLTLTEDGGQLKELCDDTKTAQVNVMMTAETKLCDKNKWVRETGCEFVRQTAHEV